MAYGSTPADSNWDPACDIAGPNGSTTPDGVIDFEDLMIFAMHYGRSDVVTDVNVRAITYQSSMGKFEDKIEQLEEEDKLPSSYCFNELTKAKNGVTYYTIDVHWSNYYGNDGYRVYRSVNEGDYSIVLDEAASDCNMYFGDNEASPGNIYSYYVIAYGSIYSGYIVLCVCDDNITNPYVPNDVWYITFNNLTTSTVIYNYDGNATPLVSGHNYWWNLEAFGYDENDNLIAISWSEDWYFDYLEN